MITADILLDGLFAAIAAIGFGAVSDPPMRAFPRIALLAAMGHALRFCLMHYFSADIATASMFGHDVPLEVTETHMSPLSPPPYMVGAAEVEVDTETGEVKLLEFDACVDCGTPINPNLTRVQAEGGILQGIGMTLTENVTYDQRGWPMENSLMQYKIPTRVDVGKVRVEFENSYEPNGPFCAKSIGEVVINTPLPAISDAIYNAIGTRFYELPITPEQIAMAAAENHK